MAGCIIVTSSNGSITSPNYPDHYDNNVDVCWLITGEDNILLSFPYLDTEINHDFVRVYGGESTSSPLLLQISGQYGVTYHAKSYISPTNQMLVVFTADSSGTESGFNATFSSCSRLTSANDTFQSPNYPLTYTTNHSCWIIAGGQNFINITFPTFYINAGDYVRAYDGESTICPLLLEINGAGSTSLATAVSSTDKMLVVFTPTIFSNQRRAFSASYSSCSVLTNSSGSISSSNYPENYGSGQFCWVITEADDYVVNLFFNDFYIYDWFVVYDGNSTNSTTLLSQSGSKLPNPVTSSSNKMIVLFYSSSYSGSRGFQSIYSPVFKGSASQLQALLPLLLLCQLLGQPLRIFMTYFCF